MLVLIVEDHRDAREMVVELLHFAGFQTATAADGFEAVEKAKKLRPAAILMDLALPGQSGWEATRQIKAHPLTRGIPIIALTAQALRDQEAEAWEAGCDGFLTKPALPPEILHELCRVLDPGYGDPGRGGGQGH